MEREREDIIQTRQRQTDRQKGGGGERKRKVEGLKGNHTTCLREVLDLPTM